MTYTKEKAQTPKESEVIKYCVKTTFIDFINPLNKEIEMNICITTYARNTSLITSSEGFGIEPVSLCHDDVIMGNILYRGNVESNVLIEVSNKTHYNDGSFDETVLYSETYHVDTVSMIIGLNL